MTVFNHVVFIGVLSIAAYKCLIAFPAAGVFIGIIPIYVRNAFFVPLIGYSNIYIPLADEYLDTKKVNDLICVYLKCKIKLKNNI